MALACPHLRVRHWSGVAGRQAALHIMKYAIFTGAFIATILMTGCGKKPSTSSDSTTTSISAIPSTAKTGVASFQALTIWEQGDKDAAISNFVATDWSARPLFPAGSIFSLSETQFMALSIAERKGKNDEMASQLPSLRRLAQAVEQAGRDAAANSDKVQARKYYESLRQCGVALDSQEHMLVLQRIGQAIQKLGDKNLEQIGR
jgi:hypothetical protein